MRSTNEWEVSFVTSKYLGSGPRVAFLPLAADFRRGCLRLPSRSPLPRTPAPFKSRHSQMLPLRSPAGWPFYLQKVSRAARSTSEQSQAYSAPAKTGAPPAPPEQETEGIKKQTCERTWLREGCCWTRRSASCTVIGESAKSDGHLSQSASSSPPKPALCPPCPPIRNRNRVSARLHSGRVVGLTLRP